MINADPTHIDAAAAVARGYARMSPIAPLSSTSLTTSKLVRIGLVVVLALNVLNESVKFSLGVNRRATAVVDAIDAGMDGVNLDDTSASAFVDASARQAMQKVDAPRLVVEDDAAKATQRFRIFSPDAVATSSTTRVRECGSPAVDGYAHVNMTCFIESATNVEFDVSAAAREASVAWIEHHASYDGIAVRWGIHHTANTVEECAQRCKDHVVRNRTATTAEALPCNVFVWCPMPPEREKETFRCFEPDAHEHFPGDCWLKFSEVPEAVEVNQRGSNDAEGFTNDQGVTYARRHEGMPPAVHWSSGVVLPPGVTPSAGTLSPRAKW